MTPAFEYPLSALDRLGLAAAADLAVKSRSAAQDHNREVHRMFHERRMADKEHQMQRDQQDHDKDMDQKAHESKRVEAREKLALAKQTAKAKAKAPAAKQRKK